MAALFQSIMHEALGPTLHQTCFVYLENIIVFGQTGSEVLNRGRKKNISFVKQD